MSFLKRIFVFTLLFLFVFSLLVLFFYQKAFPSNETVPPTNNSTQPPSFPLEEVAIDTKEQNASIPLPPKEPKDFVIQAPQYMIYYYHETGSYTIVVLEPTDEAQIIAEEAFLQYAQSIGISKEKSCDLPVTIGTIASVDPDISGKNFKPSFCLE